MRAEEGSRAVTATSRGVLMPRPTYSGDHGELVQLILTLAATIGGVCFALYLIIFPVGLGFKLMVVLLMIAALAWVSLIVHESLGRVFSHREMSADGLKPQRGRHR